jgi:hypothetical protein
MVSNLTAQLYLGDIPICPEGDGNCGSCVQITNNAAIEVVSFDTETFNNLVLINDYIFPDSSISYDIYANSGIISNYFNSATDTQLLLHMSGTSGSTTFTDSSINNLTATVSGNAKISTVQSKFDGSSAYFDGTGDFIFYTSGNNSDIFNVGSGDFSMEAFIRLDNVTGTKVIFSKRANISTFGGFNLQMNGSLLECVATNNGSSWVVNFNSTPTQLSANTWYHIALTKDIGGFSLFIDGSRIVTSNNFNFNILTNTSNAVIGAGSASGSQEFAGYIDEFRFIKGVAIYGPNNFTVPIGAFSP